MEVRFNENCSECGGAKMVPVKVPRKLRGQIKGKAYKPCPKCSPENPKKELSFLVNGKKISKCYQDCPYFDIDGGPGPVMTCNHPKTIALSDKIGTEAFYIISHPDCDTGFPKKCPLKSLSP